MSGTPKSKARESWTYTGEVWTDGDGRAIVVMPPFVRAHRDGFDYELTPIGTRCSAIVAEEIVDDRFAIATDRPHVKVTWRVTPLREASSQPDAAVQSAITGEVSPRAQEVED
jgi:hypothetical protein